MRVVEHCDRVSHNNVGCSTSKFKQHEERQTMWQPNANVRHHMTTMRVEYCGRAIYKDVGWPTQTFDDT